MKTEIERQTYYVRFIKKHLSHALMSDMLHYANWLVRNSEGQAREPGLRTGPIDVLRAYGQTSNGVTESRYRNEKWGPIIVPAEFPSALRHYGNIPFSVEPYRYTPRVHIYGPRFHEENTMRLPLPQTYEEQFCLPLRDIDWTQKKTETMEIGDIISVLRRNKDWFSYKGRDWSLNLYGMLEIVENVIKYDSVRLEIENWNEPSRVKYFFDTTISKKGQLSTSISETQKQNHDRSCESTHSAAASKSSAT